MSFTDEQPIGPLSVAVLQPTPFCNIDCRYCYLPNREDKRRMSLETAERAFRFVFSRPAHLAKSVIVAWHGGEPTVVPPEFYAAAFRSLRAAQPPGVAVHIKITTNGTLLDEEWCALFKRWNVGVHVSLDGPRSLHDRARVDRRGRGTFDKVMRGIELLRSAGVPFQTMTVLRDESLDQPDAMWTLFHEIGASGLEFSTEETLVAHTHGDNSLARFERARTYRRVQRFFAQLVALRDRDAPDVSIREFDVLVARVFEWRGRRVRGVESVPFRILSITWDGKVSTFSPELVEAKHHRYGDFVFGDVAIDSWEDVLAHPNLQRMYRDLTAGVNNCERTCPYFDLCGGEAPGAKLFENDALESTETLYCQLRFQAIGELALRRLNMPSRRPRMLHAVASASAVDAASGC